MPLLAAPPTNRRPAALARPTGEDDEWSYDWNESDRLVAVEFQSVAASTLVEDYRVEFAYDASGRRILKRGKDDDDNARTRTFFHGITEEIVKQSVDGAHSDAAFDRLVLFTGEDLQGEGWEQDDAEAFTTTVDDSRRSRVYVAGGTVHNGQTLDSGTASDSWDITGYRTFSAWLKGDAGSYFTIYVETDDTTEPIRGLRYLAEPASLTGTGVMSVFRLGGTHQDFASGLWTRVERNLESDLEARWPGLGLVGVVGMDMSAGSTGDVRMDDLALGNGVTVEHVTSGRLLGVVVQLSGERAGTTTDSPARVETAPLDHAGTPLWTYSRESPSGGQLQAVEWSDSWGESVQGLSGSSFSLHWEGQDNSLNSKETDGDTHLANLGHRYVIVGLGLFLSPSPYPAPIEAPYGLNLGNPVSLYDPDGLKFEMLEGTSPEAEKWINQVMERYYANADDAGKARYAALRDAKNVIVFLGENPDAGAHGSDYGGLYSGLDPTSGYYIPGRTIEPGWSPVGVSEGVTYGLVFLPVGPDPDWISQSRLRNRDAEFHTNAYNAGIFGHELVHAEDDLLGAGLDATLVDTQWGYQMENAELRAWNETHAYWKQEGYPTPARYLPPPRWWYAKGPNKKRPERGERH